MVANDSPSLAANDFTHTQTGADRGDNDGRRHEDDDEQLFSISGTASREDTTTAGQTMRPSTAIFAALAGVALLLLINADAASVDNGTCTPLTINRGSGGVVRDEGMGCIKGVEKTS